MSSTVAPVVGPLKTVAPTPQKYSNTVETSVDTQSSEQHHEVGDDGAVVVSADYGEILGQLSVLDLGQTIKSMTARRTGGSTAASAFGTLSAMTRLRSAASSNYRSLRRGAAVAPPEPAADCEAIAFDSYMHVLDATTVSALPVLLVSENLEVGGDADVLFANAAFIALAASDLHDIVAKPASELLLAAADGASLKDSVPCAMRSGCAFVVPDATLPGSADSPLQLAFFPVTDIHTGTNIGTNYLVVALPGPQDSALELLAHLPRAEELAGGRSAMAELASRYELRVGLYQEEGDDEAREQGSAVVDAVHSRATLTVSIEEAVQRRCDGRAPSLRLPALFDAGAWVQLFQRLLTVPHVSAAGQV